MGIEKSKEERGAVRETLLNRISESPSRIHPAALRKELARLFDLDKKTISMIIHDLVAENRLIYTNQFGCTFLELSFNKPVRISKDIILKPPYAAYCPDPGDIVITLSSGASFGSGEHPSTRLALRGLSFAMGSLKKKSSDLMLDIGTGSGVLAIAGLLMGVEKAVGSDIDPCARAEAVANASLNGVAHRFRIVDDSEDITHHRYRIVTANLRAPTLKRMRSSIAASLADGGSIVLSGIKKDEALDIKKTYEGGRFSCRWEAVEKDWAGLVFS